MKLVIKEHVLNTHTWKVIDRLVDRVEAVIRELPIDVAKMVLAELMKTAPGDIDGYPDMLVLRSFRERSYASVTGIVAPESAYRYSLRMKDVGDTVLYVKPTVVNGQVDAGAAVLEKYNPWTMETLPYTPTTRQARIVSRKATKGEVARVVIDLKAKLSSILEELKNAGVKDPKRAHQVLLGRKVTRDIGFEVVRREFGIGERHSAHWRPAITMARKMFVTQLMKKKYVRWLAVPSETRWRRHTSLKLENRSIRYYERFQKLVAGAGG